MGNYGRVASATDNRAVVVEDHYYEGGFGDAVLNAVATKNIRIHKLAVRSVPRSGTPTELLDAFGISSGRITDEVKNILAG